MGDKMMKRISMTIDEKGLDALNNLAKSMNTSRSEAVKYLIRYYLRMQSLFKEDIEALPYLFEDMDESELFDFREALKEKMDELKLEGEL